MVIPTTSWLWSEPLRSAQARQRLQSSVLLEEKKRRQNEVEHYVYAASSAG